MTVNATLIVQIVHFLLAYILIDRLFLRKAVALIQEEKTAQDGLMHAIQVQRDSVARTEEEKKAAWLRYQKQFFHESPQKIQRPRVFVSTQSAQEDISQEEVKAHAAAVQNFLIQKVKNASN